MTVQRVEIWSILNQKGSRDHKSDTHHTTGLEFKNRFVDGIESLSDFFLSTRRDCGDIRSTGHGLVIYFWWQRPGLPMGSSPWFTVHRGEHGKRVVDTPDLVIANSSIPKRFRKFWTDTKFASNFENIIVAKRKDHGNGTKPRNKVNILCKLWFIKELRLWQKPRVRARGS